MNCKWISKKNSRCKCLRDADDSGYCIFHKESKTKDEYFIFIKEIIKGKINDFTGFVFSEDINIKDIIDYEYNFLNFDEVIFKKYVRFDEFEFKKDATFNNTVFTQCCTFRKVIFMQNCTFHKCIFNKKYIGEKIFENGVFNGQNLIINKVYNLPRLDGIKFNSYSKFILYNINYAKGDYLYGKTNFKIARLQAEKISNYERVGYYYYKERSYGSKSMKKEDYINNKEYLSSKFFDNLSKYTIGYGEKPWNIIYISFLVISIFALLYMIIGLKGYDGRYFNIYSMRNFSIMENLKLYLDSWYFSMVTFTTIGYGDLIVLNIIGKILVSIEVFLGLTLASTWASIIIKRMIR